MQNEAVDYDSPVANMANGNAACLQRSASCPDASRFVPGSTCHQCRTAGKSGQGEPGGCQPVCPAFWGTCSRVCAVCTDSPRIAQATPWRRVPRFLHPSRRRRRKPGALSTEGHAGIPASAVRATSAAGHMRQPPDIGTARLSSAAQGDRRAAQGHHSPGRAAA